MTIPDPDVCSRCGEVARVIDSRRLRGYRRRRHECLSCRDADGRPRRWTTYQSRLSPVRVIQRWMRAHGKPASTTG